MDIPELGYLDGGAERDVSILRSTHCTCTYACSRTDQSAQQASTAILARTNAALLVRDLLVTSSILFPKIGIRDYADCTVPPQFSQRVKSALNAEPRSVKLASLVGSGGLWYGFGRMIVSL